MEPPDRGKKQKQAKGRSKATQNPGKGVSYSDYPKLGTPVPAKGHSKAKTVKETLASEIVYHQKNHVEKIVPLQFQDQQWQQDPWFIKERYLGNQTYMVQEGRLRYVYEAMLVETESVQIHHNHVTQGDFKTPITHSKCYIIKVLHPQEWGLDPAKPKVLKLANPKDFHFNYWDYIQAWNYAFYYQNPPKKHTWFFSLNLNISKTSGFPLWFMHWWKKN